MYYKPKSHLDGVIAQGKAISDAHSAGFRGAPNPMYTSPTLAGAFRNGEQLRKGNDSSSSGYTPSPSSARRRNKRKKYDPVQALMDQRAEQQALKEANRKEVEERQRKNCSQESDSKSHAQSKSAPRRERTAEELRLARIHERASGIRSFVGHLGSRLDNDAAYIFLTKTSPNNRNIIIHLAESAVKTVAPFNRTRFSSETDTDSTIKALKKAYSSGLADYLVTMPDSVWTLWSEKLSGMEHYTPEEIKRQEEAETEERECQVRREKRIKDDKEYARVKQEESIARQASREKRTKVVGITAALGIGLTVLGFDFAAFSQSDNNNPPSQNNFSSNSATSANLAPFTHKITASPALKVRVGPGTEYPESEPSLPQGTCIRVVGQAANGWLKTQFKVKDGGTGYFFVSGNPNYVTRLGPNPDC